jgi:hypothetical protein
MMNLFRKQSQPPHIPEVYLDEEDDMSFGSGTETRIAGAPPGEIRMKKKKKKKSVSPSKLIDLYLDEENGPNMHDDHSIGGTSDASSIPPPPPTLDERKRSIFLSQAAPELSLPRQAYIIEEQNSFEAQDVSVWPSYWNQWFAAPGNGRTTRRRLWAAIACVLVVCMILGLAGRTNKKDDTVQSNSFAGAQGGEDTTQDDPLPPTDGDVATEPPTEEEECDSMVMTDQSCYAVGEEISILFENCDPARDDWIGIYTDDSNRDPDDVGSPLDWLWTCGTQNCRGVAFVDTLPFGGGLEEGSYTAYLVRLPEDEEEPYPSYARSETFVISSTGCP